MNILTPEEVAEAMQISLRTIYKLLKSGELPARKVGGQWRVLQSELEEFLKGGGDQSTNEG